MEDNIKRRLLVEGKDDLQVIEALRKKSSALDYEVVDCGGINNLIEKISLNLRMQDIEVLGIIVDADKDLLSRWESIKNKIKREHFPVPARLPKDGLILTNEYDVKVGLWIMPNNDLSGTLEDFIASLVPKDDQLWPIAQSTIAEIERRKLNKYKDADKPKALIHTWLAWQKYPGTPMGLSITQKSLSTDSETCTQLVTWLQRLFQN